MNDNQAGTLIHDTCEHAQMGTARPASNAEMADRHAAAQDKLRRHQTPVWEGDSIPDTILRVKRGAAHSEVPVFGREFNSISTRRWVKLAQHEGV
jgi:hypothetical protein